MIFWPFRVPLLTQGKKRPENPYEIGTCDVTDILRNVTDTAFISFT